MDSAPGKGYLRRVKGLLAVALALASIAIACGGSSSTSAPGGTGGGGGTGGAGCTSFQNVGELITQEQATGTAPTPLGGTIAVGTYVLTKDEAYPPVSASIPDHKRQTFSISDTNVLVALRSDDVPDGFSAVVNLVASGTELTLTYLCGPASGASFTLGYTATPTELVLISPPGSVQTLTKR